MNVSRYNTLTAALLSLRDEVSILATLVDMYADNIRYQERELDRLLDAVEDYETRLDRLAGSEDPVDQARFERLLVGLIETRGRLHDTREELRFLDTKLGGAGEQWDSVWNAERSLWTALRLACADAPSLYKEFADSWYDLEDDTEPEPEPNWEATPTGVTCTKQVPRTEQGRFYGHPRATPKRPSKPRGKRMSDRRPRPHQALAA